MKKEKFKRYRHRKKNHFKKQKSVLLANLYITAKFKNTLVTLIDYSGNLLQQWSTKALNQKQYKKNTYYNAQSMTYKIFKVIKKKRITHLHIVVRGTGFGKKAILNTFKKAYNITILSIHNRTHRPFNGCKSKKKRRL